MVVTKMSRECEGLRKREREGRKLNRQIHGEEGIMSLSREVKQLVISPAARIFYLFIFFTSLI